MYFLTLHGRHQHLHSFPTRRSSDLDARVGDHVLAPVEHFARTLRAEPRRRPRRSESAVFFGTERDDLEPARCELALQQDRKSTRLNSSHPSISYAVFCLKKKKNNDN